MKSMIRALTDNFNNVWDECLPWILFAYREITVETLGVKLILINIQLSCLRTAWYVKSTWLRNEQSLIKTRSNVQINSIYIYIAP